MSRTLLPFHTADISALARSLRGELTNCGHSPGHVELLNMLARGAGCRNFQHFRAQLTARDRLDEIPPPVLVDYVRVRRVARHFGPTGAMLRWPSKFNERQICLWVLWSKLPPRQVMSEKQINQLLDDQHLFGDYALLRREMVDCGLVTRTTDGREYRRVERQPPPEAVELARHLAARPTSINPSH